MGAGEDTQTDDGNILLEGNRHDVLDSLADTGVDHLETGVAECAGDDLGAAIVTVQSRLRYEYAGAHQNTTGCWNSPQTALSADTISPTVQ
jgi:hypothetical protein